jgi:hypothetical protein
VLKKFLSTLFLFLFIAISGFSQTDSVYLKHEADSISAAKCPSIDSIINHTYADYSNYQSFLAEENKPVLNDIQQFNSAQRNGFIFVMLMLLLAALTYVKTAFSKYLEEMLQSVFNQNLSQQIFRTQSGELSFADILLNANFIVAISLYARFFLMKYVHVLSLESFSSVLFLIFLFTFFYIGKIIVVQFIGKIFELQQVCDEYIFNFTTLCKTLGLTLLPALFIFYVAPVKFFNFIFIITILFFVVFALIFIWRALSTAYKLLYRSVYHFFIYVCVVEISLMFLFIKLLTKTII